MLNKHKFLNIFHHQYINHIHHKEYNNNNMVIKCNHLHNNHIKVVYLVHIEEIK